MPTRLSRVAAQVVQRVAEGAEEAGQPMHVGLGIEVGEDARGRDAVFQREARARGACTRSPSTHHWPSGPRPISKAMKCRKCPDRGRTPTIGRSHSGDIAISDGGQVALAAPAAARHRDRRTISSEQLGALDQAVGDASSTRSRGSAPGCGSSGQARSVCVLRRTGGRTRRHRADTGRPARTRPCEFLRRHLREMVDEGAPDRAHVACGVDQLVGNAGQGLVAGQQAGRRGSRCGLSLSR